MFENLQLRQLLLKNLVDSGLVEKEYNPIETTTVPDWEDATPLIGAIIYLAILAYPSLDDYDKRDDLVEGLRSLYSKSAISAGIRKRDQVVREFRTLPNQQIHGRISRAEKRISKRFKIARIYGFVRLQKHFNGDASMTKYFRQNSDSDESKIRMLMRDWTDTKPVLHLASALCFELSGLFPTTNPPYICWNIEELLFSANEWARKLIYQAENNRLFFAVESTIRPNEQVAILYPDMP